MLSEIFGFGFDTISSFIQEVAERFSFFEGVQWSDLYAWMGLPADIAQAVVLLVSLFMIFTTIGFIRKLIIIFG